MEEKTVKKLFRVATLMSFANGSICTGVLTCLVIGEKMPLWLFITLIAISTISTAVVVRMVSKVEKEESREQEEHGQS